MSTRRTSMGFDAVSLTYTVENRLTYDVLAPRASTPQDSFVTLSVVAAARRHPPARFVAPAVGVPGRQQCPASAQHVPRSLHVGSHSHPLAAPPHRPAHDVAAFGAEYVVVLDNGAALESTVPPLESTPGLAAHVTKSGLFE